MSSCTLIRVNVPQDRITVCLEVTVVSSAP